MKSEILTIGDELLIGQIINTNQAFIAEQLNLLGISVERMTTVGDDMEPILQAFQRAWNESDLVLVTGGLGPTHDDITKKALCAFFTTDLVRNDDLRRHIERLMKRRNMRWTPAAEEQTLVPRTARLFPNPAGSAPGMLFKHEHKQMIVMPGVPHEMKAIMEESVVPSLRAAGSGESVILHRTLRTTGIAESVLAAQLGNLEELLAGSRLAFLPSPRGVRLRITVADRSEEKAGERVRAIEERIRSRAGTWIYGTGKEELEETLGQLLAARGLTIAVAESCTGGLIADRITNVSGSSTYFERGLVTYSNRSKTELLGVPEDLIIHHGAVSREVAEAMALGARQAAKTDIGLSTTGIAGPTGGTEEKPVGLVWIGYADGNGSTAAKYQFADERLRIKERASQAALELVRRQLLSIE